MFVENLVCVCVCVCVCVSRYRHCVVSTPPPQHDDCPPNLNKKAPPRCQSKCGVEVTSLKHLSPAVVSALKQGEEHKEKSYRALCVASKAITQADLDAVLTVVAGGPRLDLKQQTPLRVMHRRALKTREKHVVSMHAVVVAAPVENGAVGNENGPVAGDVVSSRWFELHVRTSAGMYVKEFVHGDFGRTVPCVGGLLGCDTDLLLLDVMDVHLDDVDGL